jgi:hypothetical protein
METGHRIDAAAVHRNELKRDVARVGLHAHRPVLVPIANPTAGDRGAERVTSGMAAQTVDEVEDPVPLDPLVDVVVPGEDGGDPPGGEGPLEGGGGAVRT